MTPFRVEAIAGVLRHRNTKRNLAVQLTLRRLLPCSLFLTGCLGAAVLLYSPAPAMAASGPFADFSGKWSGTGTLRPEGGSTERIRCNAEYRPRGSTEND